MGALVAGVVVPVAIEEMGEDPRFYLAGCERGITIRIAFIAGERIGCRDRGTVRINCRGKKNGVPVGRPEGVAGFGGDGGQLFGVGG